jgi:protein-S-isoprenylcysteine O-methyltransferase Ste14
MWKILVFVLGTGLLIYVSRASLRFTRSHGFYRFFAWELILALFLLNVNVWYANPFAWYQLISWTLLFASLVPLIYGVRALRGRGKPDEGHRDDPTLLAFENTSRLVTSGVYRYIRHPLYTSLLLLTWGIFFKSPGWLGLLLSIATTFLLLATARADEAECIRFFGEPYRDYMKHSKRFIPFLF